jgi:hypothetical protein
VSLRYRHQRDLVGSAAGAGCGLRQAAPHRG